MGSALLRYGDSLPKFIYNVRRQRRNDTTGSIDQTDAMDATDKTEIELIDYLRVIWKRKALIIAGTLVCMVTAAVVSLWMPDIYQSTATLLISKQQLQVNLESQIETTRVQDLSIQTAKELLNNREIQKEVIKKLDLKSDSKMLTPEELEAKAQINDLRNTDLIELRINDTDPQRAASIANAWAELFIAHVDELEFHEVESTGGFIQAQLREATTGLLMIEDELRNFRAQNRMIIRSEQIKARSNKFVALELKKADLVDKVKNRGAFLTTTLYYSITGKTLNIQAELSAIERNFSKTLNALVPETKINSQAALTRLSLNFKQESFDLLDKEALRLSKAITDVQFAFELEGKKQAIRLTELSGLAKNGTSPKGSQALNSPSAMFEVRTGRDSVKSLIHTRQDPTVVLLRQERIDSDISRDIMQSQITNYREILIKLKEIKKMVVSEWENIPQEEDGGQAMQWIKEFQGLPQRLGLVLMEFSHLSSLEEQDLAEFQKRRIQIQRHLQKLEAAQAFEAKIRSVLDKGITIDSFVKDSSDAIAILQSFPLIGSAQYIDQLLTAQFRFQGLNNDLDQLKNMRTTLEAEFEEAGDEIGALTDIVEKSLEKLSVLDASYPEKISVLDASYPEKISVLDASYPEKNGKGRRSFLEALISFKALATEMRVVTDTIADLDVEIARFKKELASGQFRELQLQRGVQTIQSTHAVLSKKWEEIKISRELRSGTVSLAKAAYPAEHRIKPNRPLNALLAGVFGLMVTVFLAFFLDYFQRDREQPNDLAFSSTIHPQQT